MSIHVSGFSLLYPSDGGVLLYSVPPRTEWRASCGAGRARRLALPVGTKVGSVISWLTAVAVSAAKLPIPAEMGGSETPTRPRAHAAGLQSAELTATQCAGASAGAIQHVRG
jgi:hypothetical protein